jgi:hypothetical protein
MPFKITTLRAGLFYCLFTALLFGRSLTYEFVYDDYWRILHNPAVQQLQSLPAYFSDPETQSGMSLDGHTYRPLTTLINALTHAVAGMKASLYRIQNLLVHTVNATLVFFIGVELLGLSGAEALLAGGFFLAHPMQVETVVWVSELSNALALMWILCALLTWDRYRKNGSTNCLVLTFVLGLLGFLTRETSVCLAPLLLALEAIPAPAPTISKRKRLTVISLLAALTLVYIAVRTDLLGRASQGSLWGLKISAHQGNVIQVWPLYLERLLWPDKLRIIYTSLPILQSPWHWRAALGLIAFGGYALLVLIAWRRNHRLAFALTAFLIFWLPSSNIVPLNTLFAERFMYTMLAPAGWILAAVLEYLPQRAVRIGVSVWLAGLVLVTLRQVPVWRTEETLWANAVNIEPDSWFVWGCLGNANELIAGNQTSLRQKNHFLKRARNCYAMAMQRKPPARRIGMIETRLKTIAAELQ